MQCLIDGILYEVETTKTEEDVAVEFPNLAAEGLVEITMLRGKRGGHLALFRRSNGTTWTQRI